MNPTLKLAWHNPYQMKDYKIELEKKKVQVEKEIIEAKELGGKKADFKILLLTDTHVKWGDEVWARELVKEINQREEIDLVCLDGDFWGSDDFHDYATFAKIWAGLKSKYGIYATLGNHDVFAKGGYGKLDAEKTTRLISAFEAEGIRFLVDESVKITDDEGELILILSGIRDLWQSSASERKLDTKFLEELKAANPGKYHILMSHQPLVARDYQELHLYKAVDLILSGHTHSGEPIPNLFFRTMVKTNLNKIGIANWDARFTEAGLYQVGATTLYISGGLEKGKANILTLTRNETEPREYERLVPWNWTEKLKRIWLGVEKEAKYRAGQKHSKKS